MGSEPSDPLGVAESNGRDGRSSDSPTLVLAAGSDPLANGDPPPSQIGFGPGSMPWNRLAVDCLTGAGAFLGTCVFLIFLIVLVSGDLGYGIEPVLRSALALAGLAVHGTFRIDGARGSELRGGIGITAMPLVVTAASMALVAFAAWRGKKAAPSSDGRHAIGFALMIGAGVSLLLLVASALARGTVEYETGVLDERARTTATFGVAQVGTVLGSLVIFIPSAIAGRLAAINDARGRVSTITRILGDWSAPVVAATATAMLMFTGTMAFVIIVVALNSTNSVGSTALGLLITAPTLAIWAIGIGCFGSIAVDGTSVGLSEAHVRHGTINLFDSNMPGELWILPAIVVVAVLIGGTCLAFRDRDCRDARHDWWRFGVVLALLLGAAAFGSDLRLAGRAFGSLPFGASADGPVHVHIGVSVVLGMILGFAWGSFGALGGRVLLKPIGRLAPRTISRLDAVGVPKEVRG